MSCGKKWKSKGFYRRIKNITLLNGENIVDVDKVDGGLMLNIENRHGKVRKEFYKIVFRI